MTTTQRTRTLTEERYHLNACRGAHADLRNRIATGDITSIAKAEQALAAWEADILAAVIRIDDIENGR